MTLEENEVKLCSRCHKNHRQGFQHWCKECISEHNRKYYAEHKAEMAERQRQWRRNLEGKALERYKAGHAAYAKKWYREHPEQAKQRSIESHKKCMERYRTDPEYRARRREQSRQYYRRHSEEIRKRAKESYARRKAKERRDARREVDKVQASA